MRVGKGVGFPRRTEKSHDEKRYKEYLQKIEEAIPCSEEENQPPRQEKNYGESNK